MAVRRVQRPHKVVGRVKRSLPNQPNPASVGDVRSRRFAAYAAALGFIPAPPTINYSYGPVPNTGEAMRGGYADTTDGTVYVPSNDRDLGSRFTKAHETGHIFDKQVLSDGDRAYFQRLMQAPAGPWWQGQAAGADTSTYTPGRKSPGEWFADYYAAAATGMDLSKEGVASYAQLGPERLKRFEKALTRIAKRKHLKPYQP